MNLLRFWPAPRVACQLPALLAVAAALAGPARAEESERSRIARERTEIEARYAERERACRERFVVTSCVEDAKRERRRGLDALRARQLQLDEAARRDRAAARNAEIAAKAAEDAREEQERAARAAAAPASAAATPARSREPRRTATDDGRQPGERHDPPAPATKRLRIEPTQRGTAEERREREERSRARYEARQRQAAEHRREVTEKTAKRLQDHPPAAPLPVPGASTPR
jgi:hypothetical protein